LETHTYVKAADICAYVKETYGVTYHTKSMNVWLVNHGFSYKKPKPVPAKANPELQQKFVEEYQQLCETTPEDEPILFLDAVHPTMATKISYGWLKTGTTKTIDATASRTRMNIVGTIDLKTMKVVAKHFDTVNSESMVTYFETLKSMYAQVKTLHVILDRGPYNISIKTREAARKMGIKLHFLPPYSPNLNPIERLWKVMNEYTRNNRFFTSAKEFRLCILNFFDNIWDEIADSMRERINDHFEKVKKSPVSL
jgi:transposase